LLFSDEQELQRLVGQLAEWMMTPEAQNRLERVGQLYRDIESDKRRNARRREVYAIKRESPPSTGGNLVDEGTVELDGAVSG